jgi:outer membrane protein TolC
MDVNLRAHRPRLPRLLSRLALFFVCAGVSAQVARAQAPEPGAPAPPAVAQPLTLEDCVRIGLEQQPALAAARASLAAAETNRQALDNLRIAALISRELPVRKHQAELGVTIAEAGVRQAEAETVYAVTRNFFSAVYANEQKKVIDDVVKNLTTYRDRVQSLLKVKGDPKITVTTTDLKKLNLHVQLYQLRMVEADRGVALAKAALREAMGLPRDCPLLLVPILLPEPGPDLDLHALTDLALARRGELVQAQTAAEVTDLEVTAQGKSCMPTFRTFAAVSDIHSREVPQGISNREYRPGAVGLDMPTTLAGRRHDRMQRARDLSARASSVVEKTTNLIVLETEANYLKLTDAATHVRDLKGPKDLATQVAADINAQATIKTVSFTEEVIKSRTLEEQVASQYNEARYLYALALAALERITAGGFCPFYRSPARPPE